MNVSSRQVESDDDAVALSIDDDFSCESTVEPIAFDSRSYARWAHGLWLASDAETLDAAIAATRRRNRDHPALWLLRGVKSCRWGDYASGIDRMDRAVALADDDVRDYYLDPLFATTHAFGSLAQTEDALARFNGAIPSMAPIVLAGRSMAAIRGGDVLESRRASEASLAQISKATPYVRARVLERLAVAAFARRDFSEAEMMASQAQHAADACNLDRVSFAARSVLYSLEGYVKRSSDETRALAREMLRTADSHEDRAFARRVLISEFGFAGERGDDVTMRDMRERLRSNRASGDLHTVNVVRRFDALFSGWEGNFANAVVLLEMNLRTNSAASYESNGERALDQSLLGAAYLGLDDLEQARRYSRRAISGTVAPRKTHETPGVHARRFRTRLIGALTAIALGDHVRGRRALSAAFLSSTAGRLPDVIESARAIFPANLQGYARFVDAAHAEHQKHTVVNLTKAEREVLAALDQGGTYATVAASLGKSVATVKMQCHSAFVKLGARDRVSALRRFREIRESSE